MKEMTWGEKAQLVRQIKYESYIEKQIDNKMESGQPLSSGEIKYIIERILKINSQP